MSVYNLIEYSNSYSKTSGILWQYFRDEPDDDYITHSELFKFKSRFTNSTNNDGIQVAEIAKLLKYLSNFGRNLEMLPINCEINLI